MGMSAVTFDAWYGDFEIGAMTTREGDHGPFVRRVDGVIAATTAARTDLVGKIGMRKAHIKKLFIG